MDPIRGNSECDSAEQVLMNRKADPFWESILEDVPTVKPVQTHVLHRHRLLFMQTHALVGSVTGFGINPFFINAKTGCYYTPDGKSILLSILALMKHWPSMRVQKGCEACELGVPCSDLDDEMFYRDTLAFAPHVNAQGVGLAVLLSYVTAGDLHERVRQRIFNSLDDQHWEGLTAWTVWAGKPRKFISDNMGSGLDNAHVWGSMWSGISNQLTGLYPE